MRPLISRFGNSDFRNFFRSVSFVSPRWLEEAMEKTYRYIDERPEPESIILGSSNPILPPNEVVIRAAQNSLASSDDIYLGFPEEHQRNGNTLRYYGSRSGRGIDKLRKNMMRYLENDGFPIDKLDFWVSNSIQATILPSICDSLLRPGDSVLLTIPTYGPFFSLFQRRGMDVVALRLEKDTNWKITPEALKEVLDKNSDLRFFTLLNPGNPMGELYNEQELIAISDVIKKENEERKKQGKDPLFVFCDEVAKNSILGDNKFVSIGSLPGMAEYTLTGWSLSKDLAPGLGVAILIGDKSIIDQVSSYDSGPPFAMQHAAAAAFDLNNQETLRLGFEEAAKIYNDNFQLIEQRLIPNLNKRLEETFDTENKAFFSVLHRPEGGFQVMLDASVIKGLRMPEWYVKEYELSTDRITSSMELALFLKRVAKVELIPGEGFGFDEDAMNLRMTLSKRDFTLGRAFDKIGDALCQCQLTKDANILHESNNDNRYTEEEVLNHRIESLESRHKDSRAKFESMIEKSNSLKARNTEVQKEELPSLEVEKPTFEKVTNKQKEDRMI